MRVLTDHISKEMNELNVIRCKRIPKRPGADWRDLPDEKVRISRLTMCRSGRGLSILSLLAGTFSFNLFLTCFLTGSTFYWTNG